jgi:hypothetical protein
MNGIADRVSDGDDPQRSGCARNAETVESHRLRTPDGLNFMVQVRRSPACEAVWGRLAFLTSLRPDPDHPIRVHMIVRRPNTKSVDDTLGDFNWDLLEFGPHIYTNMLLCTGGPVQVEVRVGDPGSESELWISKAWTASGGK